MPQFHCPLPVRPVFLALLLAALASPTPAARAQAVAVAPPPPQAAARPSLPSPEQHFGFRMGEDGKLAGWAEISRYFAAVAAASDRVDLVEVGETTEGQKMIAAVVSAPENLARVDRIREASLKLANPRTLGEDEARRLLADQKAIVALGCSIHATEIGATQMANELLHLLATTNDPGWLSVLRDTVILLIPSLNPDGHRLVVDWYDQTKGTSFEGAPMPWLYHKYAGHDINRDAFMMNLAENRSLARFFYREWHPQVFLTLHQMGPRGPRFFVPPNYDPIGPNEDPLIWRTAGLLGGAMSFALERAGKSGVISSAMYDYYWPGYEDSAPLGHNIVCLLTEVASAKLAWPLDVAANELSGATRGLSDYRPQVNFPNPWPGGHWGLRDIVDYELIAVRGLLDAVVRYRTEIVENAYAMARRAVERGNTEAPFAFLISQDQHDPSAAHQLVSLLLDAGVEIHRASEPFRIGTKDYAAGTEIVLMAQPYRAYAKTLLERQEYPARRLVANGPPERPYDVAGWTLPLQMGVTVETIQASFELPVMTRADRPSMVSAQLWGERRPSYYLVDARGAGGATAINRLLAAGIEVAWTRGPVDALGYRYAPGTLVVRHSGAARKEIEAIARELGLRATGMKGRLPGNSSPIGGGRVALYKPWVENIDEGWTRLLLERYGFRAQTISDADIRRGGLRTSFDAIVIPDAPPERLVSGHKSGTVPEQYVGGLGNAGLASLAKFAADGGTLVCLDSSCQALFDALHLPVVDTLRGLPAERFFCPGSILSLTLESAHPLTYGMTADTAAFFSYGSAYELRPADANASGIGVPAVVGRYGTGNPLLSGWLEGPEQIAGRSAIVEVPVGAGRVVLIGFRTQHRAQSNATFRVLFNALFTATHAGQ